MQEVVLYAVLNNFLQDILNQKNIVEQDFTDHRVNTGFQRPRA